jgi:hypothetical protein
MFTPSFTTLLFRRMEGQTEKFTPRGQNYPLEDNFDPGNKIHPWRTTSTRGTKFTPGG